MATAVAAPEAWAPGHEATRPRARSGLCGTCWLDCVRRSHSLRQQDGEDVVHSPGGAVVSRCSVLFGGLLGDREGVCRVFPPANNILW